MYAIDIDGVIADSEPILVKGLEDYTKQKFHPANPRKYDFRDGFDDLSLKDCLTVIDETLLLNSDTIPVYNYDRTYLALAKIQAKYGSVTFITSRNLILHQYTSDWIKKHFGDLNFELYTIGHGEDKEWWMYKHNLRILIEDRLKTVNELQNPINFAYLVNRPWNEKRDTRMYVTRVYDLLDAVDHSMENLYL